MTQLDDRPGNQTDPAGRFPDIDELEAQDRRRSAGRIVAVVLLLVGVMLVATVVGYMLAGGRLPGRSQTTAQAPAAAAPTSPPAPQAAPAAAVAATAAATAQATATAPSQAASAPKPAQSQPQPSTQPQATTPPQPTAPPPTSAPAQPTPAPPTTVPATPVPPTAASAPPAAASKPAAPVSAPPGVGVPVRPGIDARQAQIEGRVREYFQALQNEDYARAQQVCCTAEWRSRYPLEQWQRNFNGVSDLRLVGEPRYLDLSDQQVIVDTDYTFVSGGAQRNFTLRWTFRPVGSEWQAELAEAFPTR